MKSGDEGELSGLKRNVEQSGSQLSKSREELVSQLKLALWAVGNDSGLQGKEHLEFVKKYATSASNGDSSRKF